ncbi:MAG: hypothetical protein HY698_16305 [Deltaproteobacteria bacterium]|nr:hypothetical protein [Deltaproteobacteria bacterium]
MTTIAARTKWVGLAGLSLAIMACTGQEAADPDTMQKQLGDKVPRIVNGVEHAFLRFNEEDSQAARDLNHALRSLNLPVDRLGMGPSDSAGKPGRTLRSHGTTAADEATDFLTEHVFSKENYEGDGVYRLRGEDFCENTSDDGHGMEDPDTACIEKFNEAEFRIRAVVSDASIELTLLVGPGRAEPLTLEADADSVSIALDLAEAKKALEHLSKVFEEDMVLPTVMEGVIAFSLTLNGEEDATASITIRKAVRIEGNIGEKPVAFSTAAGEILKIRGQGKERRLSVDVNVGPTTLRMPWPNDEEDSSPITGTLAVDLKGLSASTVLEDGMDTLRFSNIGLGDGTSSIKLDDENLLTVDVNENANRRFALNIVPGPMGGAPSFVVEPSFDLKIGLSLKALVDQGQDINPYLVDETFRIGLDGTTPRIKVINPEDAPARIRVMSGQLSLESRSALNESLSAQAGQCLVERNEDAVQGKHPILSHLNVISCE